MILIEKKQTGGSIGKAGRLHVQPTDRSASLQFNPQVREVTNVGNKTMGSSYKANEKLYNGMLPSDQDYIRGLKENKMQEITEKYKVDGYEGSQENIRDLEEWRSYDASMASKGKHYATRFTKNAGTVKSRKAEASLAMQDGNVLAQTADGSYTIMSYDDLLKQDSEGNMTAKPLRVSDAILLRQSDPSFNSFGALGEFVDNVLMNTYAPDDLNKSMKNLAATAGTSSIPIDADGTEMSVEKLIRQINAKGGIAAYMKTNKSQMASLANYFRNTIDAKTDQYLDNQAVDTVYNQLANGSLKLEKGETIKDKVSEYKNNLINNYFYNAISTKLNLKGTGQGSGGSKGPGAQRKYEMNPMAEAQFTAGSQKVSFTVPTSDGKVERQEYMGTNISDGNAMFNTNKSYGIEKDVTPTGEAMSIANNKDLKRVGGTKNFEAIALADGTVLSEEVGLHKTMIHPNSNFDLAFIPVKENPSKRGGYVPDFESVSKYHMVLKDLHDMWAAGLINSPEDIEAELIKRDLVTKDKVKILPVMAFDVVLRDDENINDRYLESVKDDATQDRFENAADKWVRDKKIKQTKAFMVVDDPSVYAISNYFGNEFVYKVDTNAASALTSGLIQSLVPITDVQTSDQSGEELESLKEGGKAPTADDIHNLLFNN